MTIRRQQATHLNFRRDGMKKDELKKIMQTLYMYYPDIKADPVKMVDAWYEIMKDYGTDEMRKAVTEFTKNDQRDYPTFPHIGKIVQLIEKERRKYKF